jgi:hypothetical protein
VLVAALADHAASQALLQAPHFFVLWIIPCRENTYLLVTCKPEMAGSLASISGYSGVQYCSLPEIPKEAEVNLTGTLK